MTDTTYHDYELESELGLQENSILIQEADFVYQVNWFHGESTLVARVIITEDYLGVIEPPAKLNGSITGDEIVTFTAIIHKFALNHRLSSIYWIPENRIEDL